MDCSCALPECGVPPRAADPAPAGSAVLAGPRVESAHGTVCQKSSALTALPLARCGYQVYPLHFSRCTLLLRWSQDMPEAAERCHMPQCTSAEHDMQSSSVLLSLQRAKHIQGCSAEAHLTCRVSICCKYSRMLSALRSASHSCCRTRVSRPRTCTSRHLKALTVCVALPGVKRKMVALGNGPRLGMCQAAPNAAIWPLAWHLPSTHWFTVVRALWLGADAESQACRRAPCMCHMYTTCPCIVRSMPHTQSTPERGAAVCAGAHLVMLNKSSVIGQVVDWMCHMLRESLRLTLSSVSRRPKRTSLCWSSSSACAAETARPCSSNRASRSASSSLRLSTSSCTGGREPHYC